MTTNIPDGIAVGGALGYTTTPGIVVSESALSFDGTPVVASAAGLVASAILNGACTLVAGTGTTRVVDATGTARYVLDYPRNILITGAVSGSSVTFTVVGYDRYGRAMSEAITGPTTSTAAGKKAFASVTSITTSGTTTSAFTVGSGSVLGLSFYLTSGNYITGSFFDGTADAGTIVVGDATTPATTTTGDSLGTYAPAGTMNGAKRVTVYQYVTPAQVAASGNQPAAVYGITPV